MHDPACAARPLGSRAGRGSARRAALSRRSRACARDDPVRRGRAGESAIAGFPGLSRNFARRLPNYDVVTFDQRGTGLSGPLRCGLLGRATRRSIRQVLAECGNRLGAARVFHRTTESVDDIEAVRQAIGAPQIALFAVSYGGRVAGEYARRYPSAVSRMVLDSPAPLTGVDPFDLTRQAALPRVLASLCAARACRSFTRSARRDLSRLAARLRRRPLGGFFFDSRGRRRKQRLGVGGLYELTISLDTDPLVRIELPSSVRAALKGDEAPLLRTAIRALGGSGAQAEPDPINFLTNTVTLCAESPLPWDPASLPDRNRALRADAAVRLLGRRAFAPWGVSTVVSGGLVSNCLGWPPVPAPPPATRLGPAVPTLVLSGREDLRTPLEHARTVAAGYPRGQLVEIPFAGHSVVTSDLSGCAPGTAFAFLGGAPGPFACPPRPRPLSIARRAPRRFGALRPKGARGRRGRTLTAVRLTLRDLFRQLTTAPARVRLGGLRGGRFHGNARTGRIRLFGYRYVPRVRVSGLLRMGSDGRVSGRVRVRGGGSRRATVRVLPSGRLRGRFSQTEGPARASVIAIQGGAPLRVIKAPRVPLETR